jgi:hypothetical protein
VEAKYAATKKIQGENGSEKMDCKTYKYSDTIEGWCERKDLTIDIYLLRYEEGPGRVISILGPSMGRV